MIIPKFKKPDFVLFSNLKWTHESDSYVDLVERLKNKNPYSITVILENLDYKLSNNPKYVQKTKCEISTKYHELIFDYFFKEFGVNPANDKYRQWLDKGMTDDEIYKSELETRYLPFIEKRFKNIDKLKLSRHRIDRKRYYNLPEPLNQVDWRSPYDNLFIWTENGQKFMTRGGSGSSGARETNSRFIYTYGLINQQHPISSYLYIYTSSNELFCIRKFSSFTIPGWDIGSNYQISKEAEKEALRGARLIEWEEIDKFRKLNILMK